MLQDQGNVSTIQWMPDLTAKETIVTCAASNKLGPQVKDNCIEEQLFLGKFKI